SGELIPQDVRRVEVGAHFEEHHVQPHGRAPGCPVGHHHRGSVFGGCFAGVDDGRPGAALADAHLPEVARADGGEYGEATVEELAHGADVALGAVGAT